MTKVSFLIRREWLSLIFGAVLVLLAANVLLGPQGPRDLVALRTHRSSLEAQRVKLAADSELFRTTAQKLRSDDRYIERLIRRELGYARADELVYRFSSDPQAAPR